MSVWNSLWKLFDWVKNQWVVIMVQRGQYDKDLIPLFTEALHSHQTQRARLFLKRCAQVHPDLFPHLLREVLLSKKDMLHLSDLILFMKQISFPRRSPLFPTVWSLLPSKLLEAIWKEVKPTLSSSADYPWIFKACVRAGVEHAEWARKTLGAHVMEPFLEETMEEHVKKRALPQLEWIHKHFPSQTQGHPLLLHLLGKPTTFAHCYSQIPLLLYLNDFDSLSQVLIPPRQEEFHTVLLRLFLPPPRTDPRILDALLDYGNDQDRKVLLPLFLHHDSWREKWLSDPNHAITTTWVRPSGSWSMDWISDHIDDYSLPELESLWHQFRLHPSSTPAFYRLLDCLSQKIDPSLVVEFFDLSFLSNEKQHHLLTLLQPRFPPDMNPWSWFLHHCPTEREEEAHDWEGRRKILGDLDPTFFFQYFPRFGRPFLYFFLSQPSLPPTVISTAIDIYYHHEFEHGLFPTEDPILRDYKNQISPETMRWLLHLQLQSDNYTFLEDLSIFSFDVLHDALDTMDRNVFSRRQYRRFHPSPSSEVPYPSILDLSCPLRSISTTPFSTFLTFFDRFCATSWIQCLQWRLNHHQDREPLLLILLESRLSSQDKTRFQTVLDWFLKYETDPIPYPFLQIFSTQLA